MDEQCAHTPATYADGPPVQFELPRVTRNIDSGVRHSKPVSVMTCMCTTCWTIFVPKDEQRDWK